MYKWFQLQVDDNDLHCCSIVLTIAEKRDHYWICISFTFGSTETNLSLNGTGIMGRGPKKRNLV